MGQTMHYAHITGKCQLHTNRSYGVQMETMAERLEAARIRAGFATAMEAAEALSIPYPTYAQHENGIRNYPRTKAAKYARFFRTTPEWLLYGRGKEVGTANLPTTGELESMISSVLDEVLTLQTRISDFPRILAPALHEQLERYQADRATQN